MNPHPQDRRRFGHLALILTLAWTAVAGLVGCGGGGGGGGTGGDPPPAPPQISAQPQARSVDDGAAATFSVTATGSDLSYQWQRNGANVAGATAASYTIATAVLADNAARLRVVVSNPGGSVTSDEAMLTVRAVAPTIATQPAAAAVQVGQTATFAAQASGSAPLTYQWRRDGIDIPGANAANYTTAVTSLADNGASFTVVVGNAAGTATSNPAALTVTPAAPGPTGTAMPRIVAETGYSAARSTGGAVFAWGLNNRGQIGDGTRTSRPLPFQWTATAQAAGIALGNSAMIVAERDGRALWAGASTNENNGTGTGISDLLAPTRVTVRSGITAIAVGNGYTVAALTDGSVWGWGGLPTGVRSSAAVQLGGFADITSVCVVESSILALKRDGTVWFAGSDRGGAMPGQGREITSTVSTAVPVNGLSEITQIACGLGQPTAFGLALRRDGVVFSWGGMGGLGYATPGAFVELSPRQIPGLTGGTSIAASNTGWTAAFAVTAEGKVWAWGFDRFGALALGTISSSIEIVTPTLSTAIDNVVELATSGEHTLFVKRDGTVWAVGSNASGQLGNTTLAALGNTAVPVQVTGLNLN